MKDPTASDAFGNPIDESVSYARGQILSNAGDDVKRMLRGRRLIRRRVKECGIDRVFNLTGVTRAFPISEADRLNLDTQIAFYANFADEAEQTGLSFAGGTADVHGACFSNQVTSGMLATMLTLAQAGDQVLSVVPNGHSHPCIRKGAELAGAKYVEVVGLDAGLDELRQRRPKILAITTVTPQKFIFDESDACALISHANELGSSVVVDDAHGALRMGLYGQRPILQLGKIDVALSSTDKHLIGPRSGLIVGAKDVVERVRDLVFEFGLPAQFALYVAAMRSLQSYDPAAIKAAGSLAQNLKARVAQSLDTAAAYSAGTGVALSEVDLTSVVMGRAEIDSLSLVPMEVSAIVSMRMLESAGLMTILTIGMPGASPTLRLMMYPDGARAGVDGVVSALDEAVTFASDHCRDLRFCEKYLLAG